MNYYTLTLARICRQLLQNEIRRFERMRELRWPIPREEVKAYEEATAWLKELEEMNLDEYI